MEKIHFHVHHHTKHINKLFGQNGRDPEKWRWWDSRKLSALKSTEASFTLFLNPRPLPQSRLPHSILYLLTFAFKKRIVKQAKRHLTLRRLMSYIYGAAGPLAC